MKKKLLALFLTGVMALSLAACGSAASSAETPASEPAASEESKAEESEAAPAEEKSDVDFPTKQITLICPFSAGGASDTISRLYAAALEKETGVSVIVDNRTGAGGAVGFEATANSEADGYTIGYLSAEITTIKAMGNSTADPSQFIALGSVMKIDPVICVKADSKYETLEDYIADAKANPGVITCGTAAAGNFYHLGMLQLMEAADCQINMVPFADGTANAVAALLGGTLDSVVAGTSEILANVESGDFRILGSLSEERSSFFPDVPTCKEQGYDAVSATWGYFAVPAGTPDEIVEILREASAAAIDTDDMKSTLAERGFEYYYNDGASYQKTVEELFVSNSALIEDFGLNVN